MRMHLFGVIKAARALSQRASWLELCSVVLIAVVLFSCIDRPWTVPPMLDPLLAVPPALAGIGAGTVHRPLAWGTVSMFAAGIVALRPTEFAGWLPEATMGTVAIITAVATVGTAISVRQERRIADVTSVAEAAQRALLRPLPTRLGPLSFAMVYQAAAAEAKVGGDLYEAAHTAKHGIRVIIGDVCGKGLGAVELAADVLAMFREHAHDACTLADLAGRLDAGLSRDLGGREEFVTALLVEIDPETGRASVFNFGHPPPLLITAAGDDGMTDSVTVIEVPEPAPPLGLLTLANSADAHQSLIFGPNCQLLLYTDGVSEARDANRSFYPLPERVAALAAQATIGGLSAKPAGCLDLLHRIRADLLQHTGAPLDDDAAMLLVRAPAAWPSAPLPGIPRTEVVTSAG